ncbi:MAG TPA: sugar phosphate nucleotidyltransferase, partial [Gemmatimonadaceae bacterium]|nr:sugar phosphate nucleotidyltransferase [Gemmatimonadaceae bacterium]
GEAFQLLLSVGAGTGLIYLLRWFWWRINAWSEISAMISSFVLSLGFFIAKKNGAAIPDYVALITTVAATTIVWVAVTLFTKPSDAATLRRFYELTRPAGPGWNAVRRETDLPPSGDSFPHMLLGWTAGVTFVYAGLFGTGSVIYGRTAAAIAWIVLFVASGIVLIRLIPRLFSADVALTGGETSSSAAARPVTKAVILAAGLGTRMKASDAATTLSAEQAAAAAAGAKAMIPVGRPFLDYVLASLADAGFTDVCIVVNPRDTVVRERYKSGVELSRLRVTFAVQAAPIGTADALLAAEEFVAGEPFVALNADNYYPVDGLKMLRESGDPATLAFSSEGLVRGGISPERIARYALLEIDERGYLTDIIEKPDAATFAARHAATVSMNVWRFDAEMFRACRDVKPSSRGELELPMAVRLAVKVFGAQIRALPIDAPVLDLSHRADIPAVTARLQAVEVAL